MPNAPAPQPFSDTTISSKRGRQNRRWTIRNPALPLCLALLSCLVGVRLNNQRLDDVIPTQPLPASNAHDWYVRAGHALRDPKRLRRIVLPSTPKPPAKKPKKPGQGGRDGGEIDPIPTGGTLAQKQALLAQNGEALRLLRHGFAFPYVAPPIRRMDVRLFYLRDFYQIACLLRLEGQARAGGDDWEGAVSSNLDAIRLGEDVARGGILTEKESGAGCESVGRADVWKYVAHLNAAQVKRSARKLEAVLANHVSYAETLQEEQRMYQASMIRIMQRDRLKDDLRDIGVVEYQGIEGKPPFRSEWWNALPHSLPGLLYGRRWSLDAYNRMMAARIAWARLPYAVSVTAPERAPAWSHLDSLLPSDALNVALLPQCTCMRQGPQPDYERLDAEERNTAQNALLLAALALRAYHAEHGRWPATLAALAPIYLRRVPADPFVSDAPLRYYRRGKGYVLYSVGPDGLNNGGRPINDTYMGKTAKEHHKVMEGSEGDIIAGINF